MPGRAVGAVTSQTSFATLINSICKDDEQQVSACDIRRDSMGARANTTSTAWHRSMHASMGKSFYRDMCLAPRNRRLAKK